LKVKLVCWESPLPKAQTLHAHFLLSSPSIPHSDHSCSLVDVSIRAYSLNDNMHAGRTQFVLNKKIQYQRLIMYNLQQLRRSQNWMVAARAI